MLNSIIRFSINNKLIIGLFTIVLAIWGVYSLTRLPVDAVPDITNNQVQIITTAPSQSALDIERLVTFPVEQTMATIPDIQEIRSFSRFGLSVVTLVFHDNADVYWARQQVNERLATAKSQIPAGIGNPELAPITTGLGEIYQYIIRPKKGYEKKYTPMELRTIQDWIVRRQLLGIPGVADVASFGGYLKQYEIAIDPDKLRSYNLSISNLFTALEKNNQNTGGAYIDKKPNAWFIRSEGLISSQEDIGNIVITNTAAGIPVLIRDVADIQWGHATRYGAMTYNDQGEVTGAVTMMLKGENSNAVVNRVKERIQQIEKTLPEGLEIDAFLDRSELVSRAINTVQKNLLEGALIVILILVLFLGNLRAGLLVASVIPLSMLFAFGMMNVFGVSGNLMSLGAIDFGLIVDGAVIIVESVLHRINRSTQLPAGTGRLTSRQMDTEVYASSGKMMNSAAFGQIIILIVYLPILALTGIEGKMFKPMAQTVSFAILGALLLSLTYVPVMSALFLSRKTTRRRNFSDRMMDFFQRIYNPAIRRALKRKLLVIITAIALFIVSLVVFLQMGGEFIPTLEEGDFAVETRVLTGSSLSQTVEQAQKAAGILLKEFPDEVKEVVGKIGSSEIPTDPMPIEACDLIVVLADKSEWTKASGREELADKMNEALEALPGVTFGFQQPIQMRFNELMTGVRQDVAVKIFGEDLQVLTDLAGKVGRLAGTVSGTRDIYIEEMTGLPQIVIRLNRGEIAKYGLDVETINMAINTAFAGQSAGMVYEGERRFDMVLRLQTPHRQQIDDVRNLYITTSTGNQVPLNQLASVEFKSGPNQVQREDAKRRIIVGFNVRGRDVANVVEELQQKIEQQVAMPPGYYASFGGQFRNLQEAQARLSLAVPAALLLIFILLFFAFHSIKQATLIFTAIPMAAIGGVFALLLRGMPFSISAGVGFIALFGVAVLNGIVLIAEFNRLKNEGLTDLQEIVLQGARIRLRPVLMTASVASLGFLPMALATSAGAEVQRPLATVVIGGLITSTLLTLIVLPCLYIYFEKLKFTRVKKRSSLSVLLLPALFTGAVAQAQQPQPVTLEQAISRAIAANRQVQAAELETQYRQQWKKTATAVDKTKLSLTVGQYNSYEWGDNNVTISQTLPAPGVIKTQKALSDEQVKSAQYKKAYTVNELVYQVKQVYYQLLYLDARRQLLQQQDSIYTGFLKAAGLRYQTGETYLLEKTTAETQLNEIRNVILLNEADVDIYREMLQSLLVSDTPVKVMPLDSLVERELFAGIDSNTVQQNPYLDYLQQQVAVAGKERDVTAAKNGPEFTIGYFNQSLIGAPVSERSSKMATIGNRFQGVELGIAIPIFNKPLKAKVKAAEISTQIAEKEYEHNRIVLNSRLQQAIGTYSKHKKNVAYYRNAALPNAALMIKQAELGYREGEIGYPEFLVSIRSALQIKENYLQSLQQLNQSVLLLEYLAGINR